MICGTLWRVGPGEIFKKFSKETYFYTVIFVFLLNIKDKNLFETSINENENAYKLF